MPQTTNEEQNELSTPELTDQEHEQVERRLFVPALVVHEVVRKQGDEELKRPASALAWSGFAAGLSMGASMIAQGLLHAYLPDAPWRPLIVRLGYPLGFLMVIIGRQQLFTENTLTAIIPLMARRNLETLLKVAKLWSVVLVANIAGAHLIAWVLACTAAFRPEVQKAFLDIGREAVAVSFGAAVLRGIFAGWLIAMVVWMLAAVRTGLAPIIIIMTYIVGLGGLTHVIAGSVEALYLVWAGQLAWPSYLTGYMIPTLTGNILGGVALVSAVNHAQVVAGQSESGEARRN